MRRRDKIEILHDVLRAISETPVPTRIFYKANLSWVPVQRIFAYLERKAYVRMEGTDRKRRYYLTSLGRDVLQRIREFYRELEIGES